MGADVLATKEPRCPGNARSQGISTHDIYNVELD